jgi:hypothetical protein
MAIPRKTFGSKKFVATLPLLVAPSNEVIDQMEIVFSLQHLPHPGEVNTEQEERFLDWYKELNRAEFDWVTDDYLCLAMERQYRMLKPAEEKFFLGLTALIDGPWSGTGNHPCNDVDCFYMHPKDLTQSLRDDCQVYGYRDSEYWGDDGWDILASMKAFEESFCPEQAIVREIPLRGLKQSVRKALIREYCCIA